MGRITQEDEMLLDCVAEARSLVRTGRADARVRDWLRRWGPVADEIYDRMHPRCAWCGMTTVPQEGWVEVKSGWDKRTVTFCAHCWRTVSPQELHAALGLVYR